MALISSLTSTFDALPAFFNTNTGDYGIASRRLRLGCSTSAAAVQTSSTNDLTGNSLTAFVVQAPKTATGSIAHMTLQLDTSNVLRFMVLDSYSSQVGHLWAVRVVAGVRTDWDLGPYSPITHAWWRIREASGTVYWETSADGLTWTTGASAAPGFAVTALAIRFACVCSSGTDVDFLVETLNIPLEVPALDLTWLQWVRHPAWLEAVEDETRLSTSWVEMINLAGTHVGLLQAESVSVEWNRQAAERLSGQVTVRDPALVPTTPRDYLDGRSGLRARVWWSLWVDNAHVDSPQWVSIPLATGHLEDRSVDDQAQGLSVTIPLRDPLSLVKRAGYGPAVVSVGGLTVTEALLRLFSVVAPGFPVRIADSQVTLPDLYELWSRDPLTDAADIAAMAGFEVWTDREGTIVADRPWEPQDARVDWQEGPSCPVVALTADSTESTIPRRVVVVSTNPEVSPVVVGVWENPDLDSASVTTEIRVESGTVATQDAADNLAAMTGRRWARPQQAVAVRVVPRPDLDPGDVVLLKRARAAVAGPHRIAKWSLALPPPDQKPQLMSVTMMTRSAE